MYSCHPNSCTIEPNICLVPQHRQVDCLPSAFPALTPSEKETDWGKELLIANAFLREFDLYRAITSYKRAQVLIPFELIERRIQIQFSIVQSYYLGQKYQETVEAFECSDLIKIPKNFPAFQELLLMLQDSYNQIGQYEKAKRVFELIEADEPETAARLKLADAYLSADFMTLREFNQDAFLCDYHSDTLSVRRAQTLNAILPGAGYYYVGQKKAAFTSLIINTLFIAAAYYFFEEGNIAAGLITTSLETGWYFGGINGAGLAAKEYNERIYESKAREEINRQRLFPVLMFKTCF